MVKEFSGEEVEALFDWDDPRAVSPKFCFSPVKFIPKSLCSYIQPRNTEVRNYLQRRSLTLMKKTYLQSSRKRLLNNYVGFRTEKKVYCLRGI